MTESKLRDHLVQIPHFIDYFGFIALAETFNAHFHLVNTRLFQKDTLWLFLKGT